jgi:TfoX/Sxy family transcriptional regulator of competence genes
MQIPRPTDGDKARFRALVPADPRVEVKPMFGNLGAFVNGNMFMGLFGPDIGVKLPDESAREVLAVGGGPYGPADRPMAGYVTLPAVMTGAQAGAWAEKALDHIGALPPKQRKPQKPRSKKPEPKGPEPKGPEGN